MKKIAFITGATSGIGKACAERFAKEGYSLIITGRRKDRLVEISAQLSSEYKADVITLHFDVRDRQAVETAIATLSEEWRNIDLLINNAGLAAGFDSIQDGNVDDWERMIDTNVKGLLYVSRIIGPMMTKRKQGHIINLGSVAGREVYPKGNVYCASKYAVDALSQAMRIDMVEYNIKVSQIAAGAVKTEFALVRFDGDQDKAENVYKGIEPVTADDMANIIYFMASLPPHVNINDLLVMPTAQASAAVFNREI